MDMMWYRRRGLMVTPHIESVTGAIASFNSDYNKIPIKSLICDIEPIQEGEGDPSPENVRAINGRTGVKLWRTGKNLLDKSKLTIGASSLARYSAYGSDGISSSTSRPNGDLHLYPGAYTVSLSGLQSTNAESIGVFNSGGTRKAVVYNSKILSFNITEEDDYMITFVIKSENFVSWDNYDIQLELGSTATAYEPYKGSTYSVNWETEAGTVYGGYVDVVSGKLTVNRGYNKLSDLTTWGANSSLTNGVMRAVIPNVLRTAQTVVTTAIMDCRKAVAYGPIQVSSTTTFAISYDSKLIIPMNREITVAEFLSEYGNHEICYPLATPIEIQLTTQEIRTLLGLNNIWCDSGDVTVDYWKWGK